MPRKKREPITVTGRPQIPIDWNKVDKWLQGHATREGIAGLLGMHPDTLSDRCHMEKGVSFAEYSTSKKAEGKSLLAVRQFSSAMSGNSTMLKLLGEEWLDQGKKNYELPPNDEVIDAKLESIKFQSELEKAKSEIEELKQKLNATQPKADPELQPSE